MKAQYTGCFKKLDHF